MNDLKLILIHCIQHADEQSNWVDIVYNDFMLCKDIVKCDTE